MDELEEILEGFRTLMFQRAVEPRDLNVSSDILILAGFMHSVNLGFFKN